MDKHRHDPEARRDYLNWLNDVPGVVGTDELVTYVGCVHFGRIRSLNDPSRQHPNLGHCAKGEPKTIVSLWDSGFPK